jgi:hypothetical protein
MKVMLDPATPLAVRARCGFYILEQTRRDIETDEIEGRLAELERKVKGSESRT